MLNIMGYRCGSLVRIRTKPFSTRSDRSMTSLNDISYGQRAVVLTNKETRPQSDLLKTIPPSLRGWSWSTLWNVRNEQPRVTYQ